MNNWDEIRTAAEVARLGTISAAADSLGIHRATVNRHVDLLEDALGAKLFLRHARGFTPTELGLELLRVANVTHDQFSQLRRHAAEQRSVLSGELIITAVDILVGDILPAVKAFRTKHPKVTVRILSSDSILKLEYGEAHIALRGGKRPEDPDNVVQPFRRLRMGLYAHEDYVTKHGVPQSKEDYAQHIFIGPSSKTPRVPFLAWMLKNIPEQAISVRSDQMAVLNSAVFVGLGIGFLPEMLVRKDSQMIQIMKPRAEWCVSTWLVTHVDLHRTAKVQAFLNILKVLKTDSA